MAEDARATAFKSSIDRGTQLAFEGKVKEAATLFESAARTWPDHWCTHAGNLGTTNPAAGMMALKKLLALPMPAMVHAGALNNMGKILAAEGHDADASAAFDKAWQLYPNSPDTASNRALIEQWRGNFPEAERWANRALKLHPWHIEAQFIIAMVTLLKGDYLKGFDLYECRWRSSTNGLRKVEMNAPEWDGTNGKCVFVYGEQGSGDSLLMLRYAKLIRERGVKQLWCLQKGMRSLVDASNLVDRVLDIGEEIPAEVDCHIPAASLPRLFKTTLNTVPGAPYLTPPTLLRSTLPRSDGFRVGIAWRGSKVQSNDRLRSTRLSDWLPVLKVGTTSTSSPIQFHSLQVDGADEALLYPKIICHSAPSDWFETAQRVCGMDLVISVDTSVVHLCGALGIPCWVALHCRPYFVYPPCLDISPWYPKHKLFKQTKAFEWTQVFERIADELAHHPTP